MMKTETIEYFLTDEDGKTYPVVCTVTYKRNKLERTNSESNSVAERTEPFHSGMERD